MHDTSSHDNTPLASVEAEAERILQVAEAQGVRVRLIGGLAVFLRCPSARIPALRRHYADLDLVGRSAEATAVRQLLEQLGYQADRRFNSLYGHKRLLFWDQANRRQVDVFLDRLEMCHNIDLRARLEVNRQTLTLADLLISKLQIVQINEKDMRDLIALLLDHPLAENDEAGINAGYIARLAASDWGLFRTMQLSMEKVRGYAEILEVSGPHRVGTQIDGLAGRIDREPKTIGWRLRAKVGDRVRWYELPDEVRE